MLCSKEQVNHAYRLCHEGVFDDYVLFRPMVHNGTGVDLLKELKQSAPLNKVPVVMLTGKSDRQVILDCLSHGANDFVVKPVQKNALITKVRGFVGH